MDEEVKMCPQAEYKQGRRNKAGGPYMKLLKAWERRPNFLFKVTILSKRLFLSVFPIITSVVILKHMCDSSNIWVILGPVYTDSIFFWILVT